MKIIHAVIRKLRPHVRHPDDVRASKEKSLKTLRDMQLLPEEDSLLKIVIDENLNGNRTERLPFGITLATVGGMEHWGHPRLNGSYFINDDADCNILISQRQLCLFVQALRQAAPSGSDQSLHLRSWLSGFQEAEKLKVSLRLDYRSLAKSDHTPQTGTASLLPEELRPSNGEDKQESTSELSPVVVDTCRADNAAEVGEHSCSTLGRDEL